MLCHRLYLNEEENIEKISTKIIIRNRHPIPWHHVHRLSCQPFTDGFTKNYSIGWRQNRQAGRANLETSSTLSLIDASGMTLEKPCIGRLHRSAKDRWSLAGILRNYAMNLIKVPFYYMTAVKNAIKRLMLPYLISHSFMRISAMRDSAIRVYAEYFEFQNNTIALLFILRMDLTPSIRVGGRLPCIRVNGNNVRLDQKCTAGHFLRRFERLCRIRFLMPVPPWIPKLAIPLSFGGGEMCF